MSINKNLVVVTWDGVEAPLKFIHFDELKQFNLLLFNYSGKNSETDLSNSPIDHLINQSTENKGHILYHLNQFIKNNKLEYNYIGIIDDDIIFKVSEFNYMLHIAEVHNLDVFQPSIAADSYFSHRKFVHVPGIMVAPTDWVEVMAPFYKYELFNACNDYFLQTISSQGLDCFMMPVLQKIHGMTNTGIVHSAIIKHTRPIRTHLRTYSNGLTGLQEIELIRKLALQLANNPINASKFKSKFKRRVLHEGNGLIILLESKLLKLTYLLSNIWNQIKTWAQQPYFIGDK